MLLHQIMYNLSRERARVQGVSMPLENDTTLERSQTGLMKRIVTVIVGLALMLPAAASANSTCSAYNPTLCSVASNTASRTTATATTTTTASTLPFTGLDVGLLAAGGGLLLGAGLVVRRLSRGTNHL
jgi:hypothetical protein